MSTRPTLTDEELSLFRTPERQTTPMSKDQTELMLRAIMARDSSGMSVDDLQQRFTLPGRELPLGVAIFLGRLRQAEPMEYNFPVVLFFALICTSPGEAVMWAYSLVYETYRKGGVYTMDDAVMALPMGMPTKERIEEVWDAQKHRDGAKDNWFDCPVAWRRPRTGAGVQAPTTPAASEPSENVRDEEER